MTTSSLVLKRSARRRRRLALFFTLAVMVSLIVLAVRYRTENRQTLDYLGLVDEIVQEELVVAQTLRDLFGSLVSTDRPEIVARIELLGEQTSELADLLEEAEVTRAAAELHGFMAVAVGAWHQGIDSLDEAVVEVMEQPDDAVTPPPAFVEAVMQLRIGDQAYASFREGVLLLETDVPPPDFPQVAFIDGEDPTDVESVARRLRLRRSFGERHDVSVTANTLPEPTGDRNGVAVLPFSDTFDVTAIVTNAGNVLQEEIEVTLILAVGGAERVEPFLERRFIAALEPGSSKPLEFASLNLEPETLYTLQVSVSIVDDAEPDNNVWEVVFATNAR